MLKVFLFVIASLVTLCRGEPVTLTVEGGVSLVGEHCPGTVRLFCEALDLTSLQLSYNDGNFEIMNFFPNSQPSFRANLGNPAFVSLNLTKVVREPGSPVAEYYLYLTVDLFQLQAQNIESISCGNVDAVDIVLVNVTIEPERIPVAPSIETVNVTYQSGVLTLLEVTWDKAKDICSAYTSSLGYTVTLDDGQNSAQKVVNYSNSCTEDSCRASFTETDVMLSSGTYMLTVQAFNSLGFSDNDSFEIDNIQSQGNVLNTSTTDCQFFGFCNTACIVRYTSDSSYRNFIERITANNTEFYSSGLSSNTTYYVEIMYFYMNGLFITDQVQANVLCIPDEKDNVHPAAIAVPVVLLLIGIVILTLVIIFFLFIKKSRSYSPKKSQERNDLGSHELHNPASQPNEGTSPSNVSQSKIPRTDSSGSLSKPPNQNYQSKLDASQNKPNGSNSTPTQLKPAQNEPSLPENESNDSNSIPTQLKPTQTELNLLSPQPTTTCKNPYPSKDEVDSETYNPDRSALTAIFNLITGKK